MSEPVKVNVVSYGGVKPGQMVVGNTKDGEKTIVFDAASSTNGNSRFSSCTGLTSWNVELPNLTDGRSMFASCTGLTSWNVELPNLTDGTYMFSSCTGLTSWNSDLPNLTNGFAMFYECRALTSWNAEFPNLTNGDAMFYGCTLDASSVSRILTTIPDRASAGLAAAKLNIGRRTNYKDDDDIAALLGTVTPITGGTYNYKGWQITVQN